MYIEIIDVAVAAVRAHSLPQTILFFKNESKYTHIARALFCFMRARDALFDADMQTNVLYVLVYLTLLNTLLCLIRFLYCIAHIELNSQDFKK